MPRLTLHLLGSPRVELDGEEIHIGRRKALALLAYLAVTGKRHRRDSLAALLWPEYDQSSARADLRRTLSLLNRSLGEGWLDVDRETAGLVQTHPEGSTQVLWLDVNAFQARLTACARHAHPATEVCPYCASLLEEAVALYRDDFLAGFTLRDSLAFDEWQFFQTQGLRDQLAGALERLVRWHGDQGEQEAAIAHARRWLALDPTHEPAHRRLMELYVQAGRRNAALRQYRVCMRSLQEELGVAPSAETTALYERIRAERERVAPVPAPAATAPTKISAFLTETEAPVSDQPVFVARERELARLDDYLEGALTGKGGVVFITGGPGRGKTALMAAFGRRALEGHPELLVAGGACNAFSGEGDPYLPFRDVMAMLTGDVEARWGAGTLSTAHARRLWTALPATLAALLDYGPYLVEVLVPAAPLLSRAQTFQGLNDPASIRVPELQQWLERRRLSAGRLDQERIFQQVADTLAALSRTYPLLLSLDDLQWVDTASASLLFHLGRQLRETGSRVLLLGAYRPEEVALDRDGERHPMRKVLSEFRRHYGDAWLDLAEGGAIEGRAFVRAYLDSVPNRLGEDFQATLSERTGGHPLFTVELLRAMQGRGDLVQDAQGVWVAGAVVDWKSLPVRVEATIQERIERLDEEERDLLSVASVEGEVFTAQVVAQVQGLSEWDALRALSQELGPRGHRLVRESGEVAVEERFLSRYQFGHALFQAYLYGCLSAGEQRLLHGEVTEALKALYGEHTDAIAPALARHLEAAGKLEEAAAFSERAAALAFEAYAYSTAIEHHRTSLRLCRQLGDRAGEARHLHFLGSVLNTLGDFAETVACFHASLHIYRALGDRTGESWVLNNLGWSHVIAGDYAKAEPYLQEAVAVSEQIGEPSAHTNALCGLARLHREYTGDFERARTCGEGARRLSREAGDLFNEALGEFIIGDVLRYQGDHSAAALHMQRSLDTMYGNRAWLGHGALCRVMVGLNAIALGVYLAALDHLRCSRSTFRELGIQDLDDDAFAESALALLYHQQGEDRAALDCATHALAIHRKTGNDHRTATALTRLGHAFTRLGELTDAAAAYQEALDLRREMGQRHLAPEPLAGLARVALDRDDPAAALTYVEQVLRHLEIGSVNGTDEPLRIYLTCARVLRANADPRADDVLETAYQLLQERAAKIDNDGLRRSYLENVTAHREIVGEYERRS